MMPMVESDPFDIAGYAYEGATRAGFCGFGCCLELSRAVEASKRGWSPFYGAGSLIPITHHSTGRGLGCILLCRACLSPAAARSLFLQIDGSQ
eukprot:896323-Amphidinium_carterae.1